jgi:hypothetical protein
MTQLVKSCDADGQSLGGCYGVQLALVEALEDLGQVSRRDTMGELLFFIVQRIEIGGSAPKPPKFFALGQGLRSQPVQQKKKGPDPKI